jgi:serine phosphatase RsbU (regulator of sigma subunit)
MNAPRDWIAADTLTLLVVERAGTGPNALRDRAAELGHRVISARDGAEAMARANEFTPDLIVLDTGADVASGLRQVAEIRNALGTHWAPAIYVTAGDVEERLAHAIESHGDDYVCGRVPADVLREKLRAAVRVFELQRENARQRAALECHFQTLEEEQQVASHLMRRLVQTDMLRDRAVEHRIIPASHLSGDLIAVARTPGGTLHVLLADGTGHGLAASLSVMPVVRPFYAMTEKGFGLPAIAREVNRQVREWLPVGRFVAATLLSVDGREGLVGVWNAGNPPVVLLDEEGTEIHRFRSRQLPLGILSDCALDDTVERVVLNPRAQLIACSDGVIELEGADGTQFGIERLVEVARAFPRAERMRALDRALAAHLGAGAAGDDLALVLVDCGAEAATRDEHGPAARSSSSDLIGKWRFQAELCAEDLRSVDVLGRFTGTMERMGIAEYDRTNLFIILAELFNNALEHGLLLLDSRLKAGMNGMERYLRLRSKCLRSLSEGKIEVDFEADCRHRGQARIRLKDSGDGFDWRRHVELDECASYGRGIFLVRRLCRRLEYQGNGNEAVALYDLNGFSR